jgi:hypothetical protein
MTGSEIKFASVKRGKHRSTSLYDLTVSQKTGILGGSRKESDALFDTPGDIPLLELEDVIVLALVGAIRG